MMEVKNNKFDVTPGGVDVSEAVQFFPVCLCARGEMYMLVCSTVFFIFTPSILLLVRYHVYFVSVSFSFLSDFFFGHDHRQGLDPPRVFFHLLTIVLVRPPRPSHRQTSHHHRCRRTRARRRRHPTARSLEYRCPCGLSTVLRFTCRLTFPPPPFPPSSTSTG